MGRRNIPKYQINAKDSQIYFFFPALLGLFGKRLYREAANVEEKQGG